MYQVQIFQIASWLDSLGRYSYEILQSLYFSYVIIGVS